MVGVPEDSQRGTGAYDLGDLVLGTNDRSHQSEGKRMCKATEAATFISGRGFLSGWNSTGQTQESISILREAQEDRDA